MTLINNTVLLNSGHSLKSSENKMPGLYNFVHNIIPRVCEYLMMTLYVICNDSYYKSIDYLVLDAKWYDNDKCAV
jgi:hypothetical protein